MDTLKNVNTTTSTNENGEDQQNVKMVGTIPANSQFEFQPTPFKSFGHTTRITNKQLCEIIKAKFAETFHDLRGVMIHFYNGNFVTEFYFEYNADQLKPGQIRNMENLTQGSKNDKSFLAGQQRIYNKLQGRLFTINDETKLLLSDYMYGGRKANQPNDRKKWDQNIKPIDTKVGNNTFGHNPIFPNQVHEVYVMVTGLDLRRILRDVVFGDTMVTETKKNENDQLVNYTSKAYYEPRYIKPLPGIDEVFVMNIEQFDKDAVEQFVAFENPMIYSAPNGVRFF